MLEATEYFSELFLIYNRSIVKHHKILFEISSNIKCMNDLSLSFLVHNKYIDKLIFHYSVLLNPLRLADQTNIWKSSIEFLFSVLCCRCRFSARKTYSLIMFFFSSNMIAQCECNDDFPKQMFFNLNVMSFKYLHTCVITWGKKHVLKYRKQLYWESLTFLFRVKWIMQKTCQNRSHGICIWIDVTFWIFFFFEFGFSW